jgi:hypothetical protein
MTARPFLASVRHEEAEGGLVTMRRGWRCLVPVEENGERWRTSDEWQMRCGMLWGTSGRLLLGPGWRGGTGGGGEMTGDGGELQWLWPFRH